MRSLKLGRWAVVLALTIAAVAVLGLARASARTTACNNPNVDHFTIDLPASTPQAGTGFTATVTALNRCNTAVTSFAGTGTLSSNLADSPNGSHPSVQDVTGNGASVTPFVPTTIHFLNGRSLPLVTAVRTVTDASAMLTFAATNFPTAQTAGFSVNPGPADNLAFTGQPKSGGNSTWLLNTGNSLTTFGAEVTIYDHFGNVATEENGPGNKVSVSLVKPADSPAILGPAAALSVAPSHGVATFSGLTVDTSNIGYALSAAYTTLSAVTSASFDILVTKKNCNGNCLTDIAPVGGDIEQANGNGSFTFISIAGDYLGGIPAGCLNFKPLDGQVPVVVLEQRATLSGELVATVGIKISAIKKRFGTNKGQPFVPICVGSQRLELVSDQSGAHTQAVPCDQPYNGIEQASGGNPLTHTGWTGKKLTADGNFDNTATTPATCDPQSGYFFDIVGSFQDYTNSNKSLIIDPNNNPTVTGWTTDSTNTYRLFTIRFPSSSTPADSPGSFAGVPWDGWNF
jgi:hypothetical protein